MLIAYLMLLMRCCCLMPASADMLLPSIFAMISLAAPSPPPLFADADDAACRCRFLLLMPLR